MFGIVGYINIYCSVGFMLIYIWWRKLQKQIFKFFLFDESFVGFVICGERGKDREVVNLDQDGNEMKEKTIIFNF